MWSTDGVADLLRLDARRRPVLPAGRFRSVRGAGGRWRHRARSRASTASIGNLEVSPDGKSIAFVGTLNGAPERSYSQSDLFVASADGSGTPRNLTASYDFDINGGIGGDQAAPRGGGVARHRSGRRTARRSSIVAGEQGDANLVRVDVASGKVDAGLQGRARGAVLLRVGRRAARSSALVSTPTNIGDLFVARRTARRQPPRQITRVNDDAVQDAQADASRKKSGGPASTARRIQGWLLHPPDFDRDEEVSVHPRDSRRAALGLRQHLHARVPVDGGEGLRRAVSQSARQQQLRPGLRQRHSVPLSGRRLQGPDGRRRRGAQARLHRREAAGRHRRQRRRAADQLDDHPDDSLCGGGVAAIDRRLVGLLVHRRLHAVHAVLVPQGAVGRSRRLRRALADHARREGQDAADARRRRRRPAHAAVGWRRDDVPRVEVPEGADRDGALPGRDARAVALGQAVASRRAAAAHRRLVRQVAAGEARISYETTAQ